MKIKIKRNEKENQNQNPIKYQVMFAYFPNTPMILGVHAPPNQENLGQFEKAGGACTTHPQIRKIKSK